MPPRALFRWNIVSYSHHLYNRTWTPTPGTFISTRPLTMGIFSSRRPPDQDSSRIRVVVYTRTACHLCDVAKETLAKYALTYEEVNIDDDDDLRRQYTDCVPVVVIDGRERFRGRIDELLLRRLLNRVDRE